MDKHSKPAKIAKAKKAFERRFGASVLPLTTREFRHENGGDCVRIFDPETGSWADYNLSCWRIQRMGEFAPTQLSRKPPTTVTPIASKPAQRVPSGRHEQAEAYLLVSAPANPRSRIRGQSA